MNYIEIKKWLLLLSLSILSLSIVISFRAFDFVLSEITYFYQNYHPVNDMIYLSQIYKSIFIIGAPILYFLMIRKNTQTIILTSILTVVGCVGRWLSQTNYDNTKNYSILISICYISILIAPYGIIQLFKPSQRGYALSIPLFLTLFAIKKSQFYSHIYIRQQYPDQHLDLINRFTIELNRNIAILAIISTVSIVILMRNLKNQIKQINENIQFQPNIIHKSRDNQKLNTLYLLLIVVGWGFLFGLGWTFQQKYLLFLQKTSLDKTHSIVFSIEVVIILFILCNFIVLVSGYYQISRMFIIFCLNLVGLFATIFLQLSTDLYQDLQQQTYILIAVFCQSLGFIVFVPLALIQLNKIWHPIITSSIFFYEAFLLNVFSSYLIKQIDYDYAKCFGILVIIASICTILPHLKIFELDQIHQFKQTQKIQKKYQVTTDQLSLS